MVNESLDVDVVSFKIDGVEVDTSYPLSGGTSESWNVSTSMTADVYFEWSNVIGGQHVTLQDTNGAIIDCHAIDAGDPSPNITWSGVAMFGSNPLVITIGDGGC
jgi:hypothetical protein